MEKIEGKNGEKVMVSASYKCSEHSDAWFFFNKNETFRLCPRCNAQHKNNNTWYCLIGKGNNIKPNTHHSFWSAIKSFF